MDIYNYIDSNRCIEEIFRFIYIDRVITKEELRDRYTKDVDFNMLYQMLIENKYIEEVNFEKEIKSYKATIIKAGAMLERFCIDCDFLEELKIKAIESNRKEELIDEYSLGIAEHTTIEHFIAVKSLIKICNKEDIFYFNNFEDVKINLENEKIDFRFGNAKRVEADLIIKYNKQWIICEVERGTTSLSDMKKKMNKIQTAVFKGVEQYTNKGFSNVVIVAAPNSKALEKTKAKIEKWEEDYDWRFSRGEVNKQRNIKILYINISSITTKKGKNLRSKIKTFQQKK